MMKLLKLSVLHRRKRIIDLLVIQPDEKILQLAAEISDNNIMENILSRFEHSSLAALDSYDTEKVYIEAAKNENKEILVKLHKTFPQGAVMAAEKMLENKNVAELSCILRSVDLKDNQFYNKVILSCKEDEANLELIHPCLKYAGGRKKKLRHGHV